MHLIPFSPIKPPLVALLFCKIMRYLRQSRLAITSSTVLLIAWSCSLSSSFSIPSLSLKCKPVSTAGLVAHPHSHNRRLFVSAQDTQEDAPLPSQDDDGKDDVDEEDKSMPMQHSKLRTLKDRMWVREALEDLTAAEFACSLASSASAKQEDSEKRKKSAVDFENILAKLEKRIEDMCVLSDGTEENTSCIATYPVDDYNGDGACWVLKKNGGMGGVTYTDDQRETLIA